MITSHMGSPKDEDPGTLNTQDGKQNLKRKKNCWPMIYLKILDSLESGSSSSVKKQKHKIQKLLLKVQNREVVGGLRAWRNAVIANQV